MPSKATLLLIFLTIFMLTVPSVYANGSLFTGDYEGYARGTYLLRDSTGQRYRERFLVSIQVHIEISPDGKYVYIFIPDASESSGVREVEAPIKKLIKRHGMLIIKVNYEYTKLEKGGIIPYLDNGLDEGTNIYPGPTPHPVYHYYKYVITIILRGSSLERCTMRYVLIHVSVDQVTHVRTFVKIAFLFKGEYLIVPV